MPVEYSNYWLQFREVQGRHMLFIVVAEQIYSYHHFHVDSYNANCYPG